MQVQPRSGPTAWYFVRRKTVIQAEYPKAIPLVSLRELNRGKFNFLKDKDSYAETMTP